jgi:retron-type reverse transcriptase
MTPTSDTGEGEAGRAWIVDADLKDFFGSVDHEKLLALVAQRVSDGRVAPHWRAVTERVGSSRLNEGRRRAG